MGPSAGGGRRSGLVGLLGVLRHRNFALVATGNFANQLGMWARVVGIGWAARELTDSPLLLGLAFGAQFLPSLLLSPFGGLVADRYDRRLVSIVGNLGMAVPTLAIAVLLRADALTIAWLLALAFAGGVLNVFTMPAMTAVIPRIVPVDEVQSAVALNSVITNGTRFVGSAAIGAAIAAFGTAAAFEFNTVAFLVVVAAWLAVRLPAGEGGRAPETESFLRRLGAGLQFARTHPPVRELLVLNAAAGMLVLQQPLLPLVASDLLDAGSSAYGLLNAMTGLGSIGGALLANSMTTDVRRKRALAAGITMLSLAILAVAVSRSLLLTVMVQVVYGFSFFLLLTVAMTIVTLSTPDRVRGRVLALYSMTLAGTLPLNSIVAGLLASWWGPAWTIAAGGLTLLAYSVWFATRRVRLVDLVIADETEEPSLAAPTSAPAPPATAPLPPTGPTPLPDGPSQVRA